MDNIEIQQITSQQYYDYLCLQADQIETLPYFENIKKYPAGSFLLGSFNLPSIIREHNLHIAIATTKTKTEKYLKILSKVLFSNVGDIDGYSISEQLDEFLLQFQDKNYPESYYKKFSAMLPVDKISNDMCQIMLDKNLTYIIASLLTFEFVLAKINKKFNEYAETLFDDFKPLNIELNKANSLLLFEIIADQDESDVKNGIADTVSIFVSFLTEIDNQFYSDSN